jgi:multidrug efflux pump subunit AcrA (membrane-fusion protein)
MLKNHRTLLITLLFALTLAACSGTQGEGATAVPTPASSSAAGGIIAEGRIVPKQSTELFFQAGGIVDQVLVHEGEHVSQGAAGPPG